MKESRFIELLNLYVDQQLTAAEAVELEMEIKHDPARRQTYHQYCQMQKACTQLFEQERNGAPASSALARALVDANRKIVAFPEERSFWRQRGMYAAGFAAVAACVAIVLVRQTPAHTIASPVAVVPATMSVAATTPPVLPAAAQSVTIPPADNTISSRPAYFSVLAASRLGSLKNISSNTGIDSEEERQNFDWMKRVNLPPLRRTDTEALTFDLKANIPLPTTIEAPSRRPVQNNYENTAFQFQQ
jgi:hypothetical protein